ncbi:MAG: glycosyltransferase 87 family protein, partial [Planktothrix sp.]
ILNAYGPLFNLLAWPAMISSLAPKIIFVFSYLVYCIYLVGKTKEWKAGYLMTFWCFSPFFWLEIAFYGHFDVMVGLLVVAAIVFASEGHEIKSAINIAMGFLLKFLPIVFLPFLAIDLHSSKKLRTRFIIVSIFSIFIG